MDNVVELSLKQEDLLKALQFFHAKLNNDIFNNKLKPVIVNYDNLLDDGELARFIVSEFHQNINAIVFNNRETAHDIDEDNVIYINLFYFYISILFHEMIHQYCYENHINDIDENGMHSKEFVKYANIFGLDCNGYRIKEELKENIKHDIFLYFKHVPHIDL